MLFTKVAESNDTFEVVSFKFNEDVGLETQKILMNQLNECVSKFSGFKARDYFFSTERGMWIDFVVWQDIQSAKKASDSIMSDKKAVEVFSKMDQKTMIFSHYSRVGGV